MNKLTIKVKLVLLFLLIKMLPLVVIMYIAYMGILNIHNYINDSTRYIHNQSKEIIVNTANMSIEDSINNLNKKSQETLERLSIEIADKISNFLKNRDQDLLFLSKLELSDELLEKFYKTKNKDIVMHSKYRYNDELSKWELKDYTSQIKTDNNFNILDDNKKEFNYVEPNSLKKQALPIYKEITFFDLNGVEKYKISTINKNKLDISKKQNTYINSENYFNQIKDLKEGEIFVSDMIGEYVGSKVIGVVTKEKTKSLGIDFKPEEFAYAGLENPVGKRYDGIIRFITPVFKNKKKIGFLTLALDHRHLMEFTDNINPVGKHLNEDINDARIGNYAFLFDYKARNISHIRDYFITGFDKTTGKRVTPWLSANTQKAFEKSGQSDIDEFLKTYPKFNNPSLEQKPNLKQLKQGKIPVECEYLNFAPHCYGWVDITKNGGHGSFIIYWSGVWKLVTAAPIHYKTGKYKDSPRGFGFVTIGANVDEFHAAANETKKNISDILRRQNALVTGMVNDNKEEIDGEVIKIINKLTFSTLFMIILVTGIAIWLSNYISSKIENLLIGTQKFARNDFSHRIVVSSQDEIGNLERSFNEMASKINKLVYEQSKLNEHLEEKVEEKTRELKQINENLEGKIVDEVDKNRQKDAQLVQHSKMAALGEMISMIIHQWKQPLNAISMINSSQELRIAIGDNSEEELKKDNASIKKQIEQMTSTMNDFRDFFKNTNVQSYNVDKMIKKAINLIQNIYKYQGIFLSYEASDDAKDVKSLGFENEIIQVIINILNNSRDAILKDDSYIKKIDIQLYSIEDEIVITIQDYAGGIPDEIIDNIFEAYFTTKGDDEGTGLGLYMCKTILDKVEGNIRVRNAKNIIDQITYDGAKFTISLKKDKNGKI